MNAKRIDEMTNNDALTIAIELIDVQLTNDDQRNVTNDDQLYSHLLRVTQSRLREIIALLNDNATMN